MAWLRASNLGKTNLVSDDGTTLEVEDTSVFPDISGSDDTFRIVATDKRVDLTLADIEIIDVGGVDEANNLLENLTRGLEGTTEKTWASGDIVEQRTTAQYLDEIHKGVDAKTDQTDFDNHSARHENTGADELNVSGLSGKLADEQEPESHDLAGGKHNTDTLANLNLKISDANVDDDGDSRPPDDHNNDNHTENYITSYTNNYVNSVTGDGDSTLTLGREGLTDLTQNLSHNHDALYDDYNSWTLSDGVNSTNIGSGNTATFADSGLINISESAGTITISTDANNYSLENHNRSHHTDIDQSLTTNDSVEFNQVGVGTSSPEEKIDVVGKVQSSEGFKTGNYEVVHNDSEDSLDFVYIT